MHFQHIQDSETNPDGFVVIPDSEVVVTRTAYRDNTSEYRYNGKKISFKILAVELRKLGIDLDHNRFLILQGEVEQISLMPPKGKYNEKGDMVDEGMLEYLEDIIGSNVFIEAIKAAEAKVRAQRLHAGGLKVYGAVPMSEGEAKRRKEGRAGEGVRLFRVYASLFSFFLSGKK